MRTPCTVALALFLCGNLAAAATEKRIPAALSHNEGKIASGPLNYECTDTGVYSSYPLIMNASIRDAHESPIDGPNGFLYFTAAGTEKTGSLPLSLGGRSGWDVNVWASNFQGPHLVSNSRVQWEWAAGGKLEQANHTYPAPY